MNDNAFQLSAVATVWAEYHVTVCSSLEKIQVWLW